MNLDATLAWGLSTAVGVDVDAPEIVMKQLQPQFNAWACTLAEQSTRLQCQQHVAGRHYRSAAMLVCIWCWTRLPCCFSKGRICSSVGSGNPDWFARLCITGVC
jgi:hypothetical protein